jgi:hypothetical protein
VGYPGAGGQRGPVHGDESCPQGAPVRPVLNDAGHEALITRAVSS